MSFSFGGTIVSEIVKSSFWNTYQPQITITSPATISTSNVNGRYLTSGKLVHVNINFQISSVSDVTKWVSFSLPFIAEDSTFAGVHFQNNYFIGHVGFFNSGTSQLVMAGIVQGHGNQSTVGIQTAAGATVAGLALPQTFSLSGWYVKV